MEPNFHTPTNQQWSLTIERGITKDLLLQVSYVGSETYHLPILQDTNVVHSQVCADPQGCGSGGVSGPRGLAPQGTRYVPPGPRPNPFVDPGSSWIYQGNASYHALNVSVVQRATRGLTFKTNYTFGKVLDVHSAIITAAQQNSAGNLFDPYNLRLSKGVASYSLTHQFNANVSYELPLGRGQRWGSGVNGALDKLIGGWQWNGILAAQSGFPFSLRAGSNISGTGDTGIPDAPSRKPGFSGPAILEKVNRWFDPNAFVLPIPGTFGNVARGSFMGPGLTTIDTSLFKKFNINERWSLQFRAEVFNLLNHTNFSFPNAVVFQGSNINPSAGVITATTTSSRQIQLALKLLF